MIMKKKFQERSKHCKYCKPGKLPISPLLDDSVNDGVPSVHVGVLPSTDAGGVHVRFFVVPLAKPLVELDDSTLNEDL